MDLGEDYRKIRKAHPDTTFTKVYTFNSARKSMSTVIPLESGGYRVFTKGASEIIMSKCSFIYGEGGRIDKFTKAARERCVKEVWAHYFLQTFFLEVTLLLLTPLV